MHLLVIEDERALCETIVRSLRRLAYSVDYCYDGEKALELLGVERYDLVLLDLNLPGKDGMTVLRILRGQHHFPEQAHVAHRQRRLRLLDDVPLRQRLVAQGLETAQRFCQRREARETLAWMERVLA